MSKYETLDAMLLSVLADGPSQFIDLQNGALWAECRRLESVTGSDDFRILDRRLQALRRAGKIRFSGAKRGEGWQLADAISSQGDGS
ncbi:hypothetical protein KTD18_16015 [Burkholderia multivorans]|uniref:hypothetical protein n=1 Tax=Burkholderia multivorans TaxID=87883 RepID=UPI001C22603D|nr:hypothetical protein [Burkholderia multivorans]MBU9293054.1 hypothetical protein [Burkholderia multivorans]